MRICVGAVLAALVSASSLSAAWTLYICMATSKGYVVGAKLPPSGIFRRSGAGEWQQRGYNHPFTFGLAPGGGDTLYVAAGNGLIRTRGGEQWKFLTGSDVTELRDVSVGQDGSIWFAYTAGLRVSRDRGKTWTERSAGLPRRYSEAVRVDRTEPEVIVTGGEDGIWRSADRGATWKLAGASGWQIMNIEQSPHDRCHWLATTQHGGVFVSNDCGLSFENVGRIGFERVLHAVAFDRAVKGRIALAGWAFGVATSEDNGKTWSFRNSGLPSTDVWAVAFDPGAPGRMFASVHEEAVFRSDDAGKTWVREALEGSLVTRMMFVEEGAAQ